MSKQPKRETQMQLLQGQVEHLAKSIVEIQQALRTPDENLKCPPEMAAGRLGGEISAPSPANRQLSIVENEAQNLLMLATRLDNYNYRLLTLLRQFGVAPPPAAVGASPATPTEPSLQDARRILEERVQALSDILSMTT